MLLAYVLVFYRPYFNSDDAALSMLADEIWKQGRLLPLNWVNNNGDLMVPSGAWIVAFMRTWMPNGYAAHSAASVFAVFVSLGALAWLLKVLRMPSLVIFCLTAVFAAGVSYDFTFMLYAQTTYVWWSAGFCIGAALICRERLYRNESGTSRRWTRTVLLFLLVALVSFANPARVALMMVLPLYVLDRALMWPSIPSGRRFGHLVGLKDPFVLVGIVAAFAIALGGYLLLAAMGVTQASFNAASLHWGGVESVWRHLSTFKGWFYFLGAEVSSGERNHAAFLWLAPFRWLIAAGSTAYAAYALVRVPVERDSLRRAFALAAAAAFAPTCALYALFEPLAQSTGSLRYFIVPMTALFVLAAFGLRDGLSRFPRTMSAALAACALLTVPLAMKRYIPPVPDPASTKQRVADALRDHGLQWGYATWWNAGVTTVLSDGDVRVNPVDLSGTYVVPFGYIVSKDWFSPRAWHGTTFLLLQPNEATASRKDALQLSLGEPIRTLDVSGYTALVYDYNIAERFACAPYEASRGVRLRQDGPLPLLKSAHVRSGSTSNSQLLDVRLRNDALDAISGQGSFRTSVGVRLLRHDGVVERRDWVHAPLPCPVAPGEEYGMTIPLPEPPPGRWAIRVDLVAEGVAWLGDWGQPTLTIPLDTGLQDARDAK